MITIFITSRNVIFLNENNIYIIISDSKDSINPVIRKNISATVRSKYKCKTLKSARVSVYVTM